MTDIMLELSQFDNITFFEGNHTYRFDGCPDLACSVTTLIKKYEKPFDPTGEILERVAKRNKITAEAQKQVWQENNEKSSMLGTSVHEYVEYYMNNKVKGVVIPSRLERYVLNFYKYLKNDLKLIPVRSEIVVGDMELGLAGTLDQLFFNPATGLIHIADWKTNKAFNYKNEYDDYLLDPVKHLMKCEFDIYSLQLSIYRTILEKKTSLKFGKSFVVWFNESNPDFEIIKLPYLKKEASDIIAHFVTSKK